MDRWNLSARAAAAVAIAIAAGAVGAAQKAAHKKEAPAEPEAVTAPTPGNTMGYGIKLGGFFTEQHKQAAKRSFAQYFAKHKECPKDMERQGKTCRALVQGHYW